MGEKVLLVSSGESCLVQEANFSVEVSALANSL